MTLQELGQAIQEKRTAANLSVDDVASRIKVSTRILKSIEDGSLVGLPHAVYTKSFIRSFGLLVGFEPDELNKHLDELFPPESLDETRNEPGPRTRTLPVYSGNGKKIAVLIFLLLLLAGLGAGGWFVAKNYGDMILDLVKTPFSAITTPVNGDGEIHQAVASWPPAQNGRASQERIGTAAPASASGAGYQDSGTVARSRSSGEFPPTTPLQTASETPIAPAPAGVDVSRPAGEAVSAAPAEHNAPSADGKNSLRITAEQDCWISFRADGVKGRDYTVKSGEAITLTYVSSLEVIFGNAGGVTMAHNGRDIGKPGRPGQRAVATFPQ